MGQRLPINGHLGSGLGLHGKRRFSQRRDAGGVLGNTPAVSSGSLGMGWRPLTFAIERFSALPVHVLSCVWIWQAAQQRRVAPFLFAFLLKTAIDALPTEGQLSPAVLEGAYMVFGIVSAVLLVHLSSTL